MTGSGFIVLAATLSALGTIPVAGIMLIFGIDKFMSECRALTNLCGNAVATIVVSRWEGVLDLNRARRVLDGDELSEFSLLVHDDTLVTEHIDEEALAELTAASVALPRTRSSRLDSSGATTGGVALLERTGLVTEPPLVMETTALDALDVVAQDVPLQRTTPATRTRTPSTTAPVALRKVAAVKAVTTRVPVVKVPVVKVPAVKVPAAKPVVRRAAAKKPAGE